MYDTYTLSAVSLSRIELFLVFYLRCKLFQYGTVYCSEQSSSKFQEFVRISYTRYRTGTVSTQLPVP